MSGARNGRGKSTGPTAEELPEQLATALASKQQAEDQAQAAMKQMQELIKHGEQLAAQLEQTQQTLAETQHSELQARRWLDDLLQYQKTEIGLRQAREDDLKKQLSTRKSTPARGGSGELQEGDE